MIQRPHINHHNFAYIYYYTAISGALSFGEAGKPGLPNPYFHAAIMNVLRTDGHFSRMLQGESHIAYPGRGFKSSRRHKWEHSGAQRAR
jgi:hypothetical protein